MFFSTTDGNFQANQKDKPFDESDFSMTNGGGPLVEQEDFKKFKEKVKPKKDVSGRWTSCVPCLTSFAGNYVQQVRGYGLFTFLWSRQRDGGTVVCEAHVCPPERHCRHYGRRGVSVIVLQARPDR